MERTIAVCGKCIMKHDVGDAVIRPSLGTLLKTLGLGINYHFHK